jgi:hypothetical protein
MEAGAAADSPSTGLITTQAGAAAAGQAVGKADGQALDFELPLTAVVRILKRKLPEGVAVSKEAKVAFAKSAGMFILYITAAYVGLAGFCLPLVPHQTLLTRCSLALFSRVPTRRGAARAPLPLRTPCLFCAAARTSTARTLAGARCRPATSLRRCARCSSTS